MAVIYKHRARKAFTVGQISSVGWANYAVPGLLNNRHITVNVGEAIIRFEIDEFKRLASLGLDAIERHKDN